MPIHKIEVSEYECVHCGYRWINRVNGKDRPIPKNCAKCKRLHWNGKGEGYNPISPRERSLRVRLYKYEGHPKETLGVVGDHYTPNELCRKFLNLNPRPTIEELREALYPLGGYDSYKHRFDHYIPDPNPDRPRITGHRHLKRDPSRWTKDSKTGKWKRNNDPNFITDWLKTVIEETRLRREVMKKVIKSRGVKIPEDLQEGLVLPPYIEGYMLQQRY